MKKKNLKYSFLFLLLEIRLAGHYNKKKCQIVFGIFGTLLFKLSLKEEKLKKIQLVCKAVNVIQHEQTGHISLKPLITISINIFPDFS